MTIKERILRLRKSLNEQRIPIEGRRLYISPKEEEQFLREVYCPPDGEWTLYGFEITFDDELDAFRLDGK